MSFWIQIVYAFALSMDAFAVSVSCGVTGRSATTWIKLATSISFGLFQSLMPVLGYLLSGLISHRVEEFAGIIAFIILGFMGFKMIMDSLSGKKTVCKPLTIRHILLLSVATSLDAFATGILFGVLNVPILPAVMIIGFVTLITSLIGTFLGEKIGPFFKKYAETVGGGMLILIGIKILIENFLLNSLK